MQQKQKRNSFDQVQMLKLQGETQPAEECIEHNKDVSVFGSELLMTAGLWPLRECHITGCSEPGRVIALIPSSVQHLHVDLNYLYQTQKGVMGLSMFNKYWQLQSLLTEFHKCRNCGRPRANGLPLVPTGCCDPFNEGEVAASHWHRVYICK